MSKINYINYQEVLKDGDGYEINSYGKRKRQIKKFFKSIWDIIKKIIEIIPIPALLFVLVIVIAVLELGGVLMLSSNFTIGVIMLMGSLIVYLFAISIITS